MNALIKYVLSFLKSDWELGDYPVRFRRLKGDESGPLGRLSPIPWHAQIVNWWQMSGGGQTREEAYEDLKQHFSDYKSRGERLPRPGAKVPLQFAATEQIEQHEAIARDFLKRIIGLRYDECFISDESSLWDFHSKETNEEYRKKIADIYGIDISDIESGNLVEIFKRIRARQRADGGRDTARHDGTR